MIPVVLLCGGIGTRLREETEFKPKPMVSIGGKPMLWHIMKYYSHFGYNEFILALGYRQEVIKEYFAHFDEINYDAVVHTGSYKGIECHCEDRDSWRVVLSDTGEKTLKGGRLKRIEKYIKGDTFMASYGDGIGNVDIAGLVRFHESHGKIATVTGVHPIPRFGEIIHKDGQAESFAEKPTASTLVNGGFFVFSRRIFDCLYADEWCDLEVGPLELLAQKGELMVFEHKGFWRGMDNGNDMALLREVWESGEAPWKVW